MSKSAMKLFCLSIVLVLCIAGCLPMRSIHPFYTDETEVMDKGLVGVWGEPNDANDTWTFHARDKGGYTLDITEKKNVSNFEAHLFTCGDTHLLDLGPGDLSDVFKNSLVAITLLPAHLLLRLERQEDQLTLYVSEGDTLKSMLQEDPNAIAHLEIDNEFILSAPPEALQRYLGRIKDVNDLWGDPIQLTRQSVPDIKPLGL